MSDSESQAMFDKFVSGLKIDLAPDKAPVYMFNDGTRMTDSELCSLVIDDVLKTQKSVLNAYKRADMIAPIDIVYGAITPVFASKDGNGDRLKISLGESEVVLVKNRGEDSWLLTGWVLSKETLQN